MCVSEASRTAERVCERVGQQAERVHERVRQQTSASRVRLSRFGSSPSSSWEILGTGVNVSIRTASGTGGSLNQKFMGRGPLSKINQEFVGWPSRRSIKSSWDGLGYRREFQSGDGHLRGSKSRLSGYRA